MTIYIVYVVEDPPQMAFAVRKAAESYIAEKQKPWTDDGLKPPDIWRIEELEVQ